MFVSLLEVLPQGGELRLPNPRQDDCVDRSDANVPQE